MEIRKATKSDLPTVVSLNDTVQKIHAEAHPHLFKYPVDLSALEAFFEKMIDQLNGLIFITFSDTGDPAGYICAVIHCVPENPFKFEQRVMYIDQMVVSSAYRNIGVGRMLMEKVEEYAKDLEADRIELGSWMFNQGAHKFFEKLGFSKFKAAFWKSI
ncbi:ribosomal protein S18 acetylase RimI-like enzyme [Anaerosolibacter carboniphilus]|uniref:Ribosomal protein S18 acetylase RimI-like enzyme n=1 Tax=Anaerosolibacter carboniphilus TaxID=1417629 RepID=A0A841L4D0_9FIRM|nr:GNAT family N-acetyltransferase [Anaerosolibacter carboniphilus]MBB6217185.1 ribosomal protein S18 acetylase RimI-like enzyme [Anaerosolibacter carboniphilus]